MTESKKIAYCYARVSTQMQVDDGVSLDAQEKQLKYAAESQGYEVEERKIGFTYTKEQFFEANPGARSVPQIYLNEELVPGGYVGLKAMLE